MLMSDALDKTRGKKRGLYSFIFRILSRRDTGKWRELWKEEFNLDFFSHCPSKKQSCFILIFLVRGIFEELALWSFGVHMKILHTRSIGQKIPRNFVVSICFEAFVATTARLELTATLQPIKQSIDEYSALALRSVNQAINRTITVTLNWCARVAAFHCVVAPLVSSFPFLLEFCF